MRALSSTLQTYLTSPAGVIMHAMIWISPRNRATGARVPMGFWTGDDHEVFTVDGVSRTYYGAGGVVGLDDPIVYRTGLDVGTWQFSVSDLTPEFDALFRQHDLRLAPIEVHRQAHSLTSRARIEAPHRIFKGWVETAPLDEPEEGSESTCTITCATSAMELTRTLALNKSNAFQRTRSNDAFNKYAAVSGSVPVKWGVGK